MPARARVRYGVNTCFDPEQKIPTAGHRYLHEPRRACYQNDLDLMLAAYNAVPEAVDRQGGRISACFRETLSKYFHGNCQIYHRLLDLDEGQRLTQ